MTYRVKEAKTKAGQTVFECRIFGRHFDKKHYEKQCFLRDGKGEYVATRARALSVAAVLEADIKRAYESKLLEPLRPKETVDAITFEAFYPDFLEKHLNAERRKASYKRKVKSVTTHYLMPLLRNTPLNEIGSIHVQELKNKTSKLAPKSANEILGALRIMLMKAEEWKIIKEVPKITRLKVLTARDDSGKKIEPPAPFYDFERFELLVEASRKLDWQHQAVLLLAGEAGLRLSEIVALQQSKISFPLNDIVVDENEVEGILGTPKGGSSRRVPMTNRLKALLQANRHLGRPRLLYRPCGKPYTLRSIHTLISRVERLAGFEIATGRVHILRHTFCSHLALRGATALAIKNLAGHTDIQTTQRYMHLSPKGSQGSLDAAIRLLDKAQGE